MSSQRYSLVSAGLRAPEKVNRNGHGTATRKKPRGHRGVDAPREQRHHLASASKGKPAHAAHGARVDVDAPLDDEHVNDDVGVVHLSTFLSGERPTKDLADLGVELERGERVVGVRPRRRP